MFSFTTDLPNESRSNRRVPVSRAPALARRRTRATMMAPLPVQFAWLLFLAMPIACVAWTFTHEELFKEVHEYCVRKSETGKRWYQRKFFYLFTSSTVFHTI
jgi:hypothetical protein